MSEVPLYRYALLRNYDVFVEKTELESLGELRSSWKKVTPKISYWALPICIICPKVCTGHDLYVLYVKTLNWARPLCITFLLYCKL